MRRGRRSGAASVAVQVHDLAFKALALHVGLERLIDPRRGFARVRPCLKDIFMPGLFSTLLQLASQARKPLP